MDTTQPQETNEEVLEDLKPEEGDEVLGGVPDNDPNEDPLIP